MYRERGGIGSKSEVALVDRKRINDVLDKQLERSSPSTSRAIKVKDSSAQSILAAKLPHDHRDSHSASVFKNSDAFDGDVFTEEQNELIESAAEMLYGLIHARYVLKNKGMDAMMQSIKTMTLAVVQEFTALDNPAFPLVSQTFLGQVPSRYTALAVKISTTPGLSIKASLTELILELHFLTFS